MAASEVTVKLDGVSKSFGEFTAVRDLSLSVRAGRVFGPNGEMPIPDAAIPEPRRRDPEPSPA